MIEFWNWVLAFFAGFTAGQLYAGAFVILFALQERFLPKGWSVYKWLVKRKGVTGSKANYVILAANFILAVVVLALTGVFEGVHLATIALSDVVIFWGMAKGLSHISHKSGKPTRNMPSVSPRRSRFDPK